MGKKSKKDKKKKNKERRYLRIWGVEKGPFLLEDMPSGTQYPKGTMCMNLCKVEVDGEVTSHEFWYGSLDQAYAVIRYFQSNIEPIELELNNE